jgi:hypothetical protein
MEKQVLLFISDNLSLITYIRRINMPDKKITETFVATAATLVRNRGWVIPGEGIIIPEGAVTISKGTEPPPRIGMTGTTEAGAAIPVQEAFRRSF